MKTTLLLCFLLSLVINLPLSAQDQTPQLSKSTTTAIPSKISFQGVLTNNNGGIVADSVYKMRFRIYDAESGGNEIWVEMQDTVRVTRGVFNTFLGNVNPLDRAFDGPFWLLVTVNDIDLQPRIQIGSSGYAFNTARIQGKAISLSSPVSGQVLKWDGTQWTAGQDVNFSLPYSGSYSEVGDAFRIDHNGSSGRTLNLRAENVSNINHTMEVRQYGLGPAAEFRIWNSLNTQDALYARNDGTGDAAKFHVVNANGGTALSLLSNGSSPALNIAMTGDDEAAHISLNHASSNHYALYVSTTSSTAKAASFLGNVNISGNLNVTGSISKGSGTFEIDHPLDPENMVLRHSFVESPEMMNVYNGNVTTDGEGFSSVQLPHYFDALNKDFRYQVTVIGQFAQAIVAEEIQNNRFKIQTDKPNVKLSWQVTGIRKDPWAEKNRVVVEERKSLQSQGLYLHPEAYGQSDTHSLGSNRLTNTLKGAGQK